MRNINTSTIETFNIWSIDLKLNWMVLDIDNSQDCRVECFPGWQAAWQASQYKHTAVWYISTIIAAHQPDKEIFLPTLTFWNWGEKKNILLHYILSSWQPGSNRKKMLEEERIRWLSSERMFYFVFDVWFLWRTPKTVKDVNMTQYHIVNIFSFWPSLELTQTVRYT